MCLKQAIHGWKFVCSSQILFSFGRKVCATENQMNHHRKTTTDGSRVVHVLHTVVIRVDQAETKNCETDMIFRQSVDSSLETARLYPENKNSENNNNDAENNKSTTNSNSNISS